MIQVARSAESRSFLRELEFALVLIKQDSDRNYFLNKFLQISKNRANPETTKTGERDTKSEILTYLSQKGRVQTTNIWTRALSYDSDDINNLLSKIQENLLNNNIEGIVEIHLQDREINSPHIQFVGINAQEAEQIIAQIVVNLKYETNLENAMSKKAIPYFMKNQQALYPKKDELHNTLKAYEKIKTTKNIDEEIDELIESFDVALKNLKKEITDKIQTHIDFSSNLMRMQQDNAIILHDLQNRNRLRRLRRMRRMHRTKMM